jgi:hypothetical protein
MAKAKTKVKLSRIRITISQSKLLFLRRRRRRIRRMMVASCQHGAPAVVTWQTTIFKVVLESNKFVVSKCG